MPNKPNKARGVDYININFITSLKAESQNIFRKILGVKFLRRKCFVIISMWMKSTLKILNSSEK